MTVVLIAASAATAGRLKGWNSAPQPGLGGVGGSQRQRVPVGYPRGHISVSAHGASSFKRRREKESDPESQRVATASVSPQKTLATDAKIHFCHLFFCNNLKSLEQIGLELGVFVDFWPRVDGREKKD